MGKTESEPRLLILGASHFQLPLIVRAKEYGIRVFTCDYLPDNPGHRLADQSFNVSTTDVESVLELASRLEIDGVATLSSDPAIPTVARVANALGLPGPSRESVALLSEKDRFRALLAALGFNTPANYVLDSATIPRELLQSGARLVVKPIDSSGSKGVTDVRATGAELTDAVILALRLSRAKRCIIEEYVEGHQVHGDAYIKRGKIVHHYLGDHAFFTGTRSFIPVMTRWPSIHEGGPKLAEIIRQVERTSQEAGYLDGPMNIEARITPGGEIFIIEVSPRNGGNFVPVIQGDLTGFDFVGHVLAEALGHAYSAGIQPASRDIGAYYVLHADRDGVLRDVFMSQHARKRLHAFHAFVEKGERVRAFRGSNSAVGVALLKFPTLRDRDELLDQADAHLGIRVD